ncbi:MAG: septum formation inhibitor Maf [Alphaproteobacteria bacterium]|nr:septum formation inhibitor Maf [Alphaproteobacteria bacterium]MBM3652899.1 septum formation inhibitor Maf [Alphaproteobacteria bacterium]
MDVTIGSTSPFWRESAPLILASKSAGRRQALLHSGVPFESMAADVDERAIESRLATVDADAIASTLARAKALAVSAKGRLVLGADQMASCEGRIFGKPADRREAEALLRFLSGRRHRLHSAIALVRDGAVIFETVGVAYLTMRELSDAFIAAYLTAVGDNALTSAGAYQIEGLGAQLFSTVEGDHWTIMGLPLLALLEALRREGALLS